MKYRYIINHSDTNSYYWISIYNNTTRHLYFTTNNIDTLLDDILNLPYTYENVISMTNVIPEYIFTTLPKPSTNILFNSCSDASIVLNKLIELIEFNN